MYFAHSGNTDLSEVKNNNSLHILAYH